MVRGCNGDGMMFGKVVLRVLRMVGFWWWYKVPMTNNFS